jgi:hypothetical protein
VVAKEPTVVSSKWQVEDFKLTHIHIPTFNSYGPIDNNAQAQGCMELFEIRSFTINIIMSRF